MTALPAANSITPLLNAAQSVHTAADAPSSRLKNEMSDNDAAAIWGYSHSPYISRRTRQLVTVISRPPSSENTAKNIAVSPVEELFFLLTYGSSAANTR